MASVFVSYRNGDGEWAATLIAEALRAKFASAEVFTANTEIRPGEDFAAVISRRLRGSQVLLAVIGPRWFGGLEGSRRIDDADDWVRREIAEAFRSGLRVIPVLLDGVQRITEGDLPDEIAALARCQHVSLRHNTAGGDIGRLLDELTGFVGVSTLKPTGAEGKIPRPSPPGTVTFACVLGILAPSASSVLITISFLTALAGFFSWGTAGEIAIAALIPGSALALAVLSTVFSLRMRTGRRWARTALVFLGLPWLLFGISMITEISLLSLEFSTVLIAVAAILGLVATVLSLILMFLKPSNDFFRSARTR